MTSPERVKPEFGQLLSFYGCISTAGGYEFFSSHQRTAHKTERFA